MHNNTTVRLAKNRGRTKIDWLHSFHGFSFGNYYDEENMNFGVLRVFNDDSIAPGAGFPRHAHNDMEIITIVTKGAVAHEDSTGSSGEIASGEVQVMTAGSGIFHSEANASATEKLELFQIWIMPNKRNLPPSYHQKQFNWNTATPGTLQTLVGPKENTNEKNWLTINQNAYIHTLRLNGNFTHKPKGAGCYVFVIDGNVEVDGAPLETRDASETIAKKEAISIFSVELKGKDASVLLLDLPENGL